jgi:hypothetical protein
VILRSHSHCERLLIFLNFILQATYTTYTTY